jgi:hypothetical protein
MRCLIVIEDIEGAAAGASNIRVSFEIEPPLAELTELTDAGEFAANVMQSIERAVSDQPAPGRRSPVSALSRQRIADAEAQRQAVRARRATGGPDDD